MVYVVEMYGIVTVCLHPSIMLRYCGHTESVTVSCKDNWLRVFALQSSKIGI